MNENSKTDNAIIRTVMHQIKQKELQSDRNAKGQLTRSATGLTKTLHQY